LYHDNVGDIDKDDNKDNEDNDGEDDNGKDKDDGDRDSDSNGDSDGDRDSNGYGDSNDDCCCDVFVCVLVTMVGFLASDSSQLEVYVAVMWQKNCE
jgi:hypothetical protein